jgi:hypothetical protein
MGNGGEVMDYKPTHKPLDEWGIQWKKGSIETECYSSYEEHSVLILPLLSMNIPLESLRNKVTSIFRDVLKPQQSGLVGGMGSDWMLVIQTVLRHCGVSLASN